MEKNALKIKTIFSVIFTFAGVFLLLAVAVIFPVYQLSERFPRSYSIGIILLTGLFFLYLLFRRLFRCYCRYKKVGCFFQHLIFLRLLPFLLVVLLLLLELLLIRAYFYIPLYLFLLFEVGFNALAIVGGVYLFSFLGSIKSNLQKRIQGE